jgi:small subunit ribosomal protein S21
VERPRAEVHFFADGSAEIDQKNPLQAGDCALFWNLPNRDDLEVYLALAEIRVQEGEPLENALRRFKRKVQTEDIIKEVKRHSFYLKPGEKKRVKEALARKRNRKKIRKEQD